MGRTVRGRARSDKRSGGGGLRLRAEQAHARGGWGLAATRGRGTRGAGARTGATRFVPAEDVGRGNGRSDRGPGL